MLTKKKLLRNSRLYLILDAQVNSYSELFEIAKKAVLGKVDIVQLRDKSGNIKDILKFSEKLKKLTDGKMPFILNDRPDLALAVSASGVHVGQDDIPIKYARKILGKNAIIGVSCQNYIHAQKAQDDGADYVGLGSIHKTLTKPDRQPMDVDLIKKITKNIKIPVFAIGGIQISNIAEVKIFGIERFAVCRAICQAKDIDKAIDDFKKAIQA
ncbi:MAG TPA: thiamine phosphate synthase [Candidatus Omnitrophica bacterium]|nr:thiamine phosphate synthase [Candidatus Omnitrophota bacterium]